ncbi:aminodeoxychorismate synthase component I [Synechococcus sp. PCC 7336]|uniref:aminodeoxychorismate synthase component I n=1 Tax=Synechococcus sp. PCC 7336 TaxID=195250 RepID=UPI0004783106|nr:aminodeoxychorismate synthase component I [Synechococcus sp. PCC 7336]
MAVKTVIRDFTGDRWLRCDRPCQVIRADCLDDVLPALEQVETLVSQQQWHAVGFISYEASPAFDSVLQTQPSRNFPLLYFALFDAIETVQLPERSEERYHLTNWKPDISLEDYRSAIARIKTQIACGETYQVNFTFRLRSHFQGSAWPLFLDLVQAQSTPYCAYFETDEFAICSASPELFFRKLGDRVELRPMKGTAARGRTLAEDAANRGWLQRSPKDRAENLMIVDMIRNDIGRIAELGTVKVPQMFEVEQYPSIHQMTSTVTAMARTSLTDTMRALFPCASITGAPKARTMEAIAALETSPRKLYTGCLGLIRPDGAAQFNVAIRTVVVDKAAGEAEYGVGSGVVWDSTSDREYAECVEKSRVLTYRLPEFSLLETLLWQPPAGYFLLAEHLFRLERSARYFQIPLAIADVECELEKIAVQLSPQPHKVRILVDRKGSIGHTFAAIVAPEMPAAIRLKLADRPIDSSNLFLFHKTSHREVYESALAAHPDGDDVVLWNERNQVTEACWGNLAIELDGEWFTPPVECGLLAGTFRQHLLQRGKLHERAIAVEELRACDRIIWMNSVRQWQEGILV